MEEAPFISAGRPDLLKVLMMLKLIRASGTFLLFLLIAIGACSDTVVPVPRTPVLIVAPQGTVELQIGESLQIEAHVENAGSPADEELSFRSSNPAIASVSETGVVLALSPGQTTVTIASVGQPALQAALQIRVLEPDEEPGASVSITALLNEAGEFQSPSQVSGFLTVQTSVSVPAPAKLTILLDDSVACTVDIQSGTGTRSCSFDTGEFDEETAEPFYKNGEYQVSARLVTAQGGELASATGTTVRLVNKSRLFAQISSTREAVDSVGATWRGGDLSVRALTVVYEPSADPSSVTFRYEPAGKPVFLRRVAEPPFLAVFTEAELRGIVDDSLVFTLTSRVTGSGEGPVGTSEAIRYDGVPPEGGSLTAREWIGAGTQFSDLYTPSAVPDVGVGGVVARFFAGSPDLSRAQIVDQGMQVVSGSDLSAAEQGSYRLVAQVCDALANCTLVQGFDFGVDLTPPRITAVNIPDRVVNPGTNVIPTVVDDLSQLPARFLVASALVLGANQSVPACGALLEGSKLPGTVVDGACKPDTVGVLPVPSVSPGYYTYNFAPIDKAGNVGDAVTRRILIDDTAPRVTQVTLPTHFSGSAGNTVQVSAHDDLELASVDALLVFPEAGGHGPATFSFGSPVSIGEPWDGKIENEFSGPVELPFLRTLTYTPAGAPPSARHTVLVDSVQIRVTDVVGHTASRSQYIPRTALSSTSVADPWVNAEIDSVAAHLTATSVCTDNCLPDDPTSARMEVRVHGPAGYSVPFTEMYFFAREADGRVRRVAKGTRTTVTSGHTTHVYSAEIAGFTPGASGIATIFAVGVDRLDLTDRAGRGLKTADLRLPLFVR